MPNTQTSLPSGTVTLVFTDIQGSSDLWETHGLAFKAVLDEHNRLMREAAARWGGAEVKTEGDAFFLAFARASDAVQFAVDAQLTFRQCDWSAIHPELGEIRVRIGMHTGEPILAAHPDGTPDYFGPVVNRAARVGAAGHGEQIVISGPTYNLARPLLDLEFMELGQHRLKGVGWESLWQVHHPDLPQQFPALKTMNTGRHNLPLQPNPFIGREKEINEVMLRLSESRLLTLTGSGGTGKTRLAIRAAEEVLSDFPDGVYFVPLEAITDPTLLPSAIAQTLGLREEARRPLLDTITDYLREKQILLLLDNFEQVLPAASIVPQLLPECPRLKVMVTSRAPLQVQAERQYAVPTLTLPDLKNLPPTESLLGYEAVALFIQRAVSVKSDFSVTNDNAPAVAEICHRLDGLPLAIELAAARVKLLPPQAILSRLENRLKLLTGGARDRTSRQQTLRGALAWSHELLNEEEKILFRRLSVFAGGCSLEAAEAVTGPSSDHQTSDHHPPPFDILDGLTSLVDKSLLLQAESQGEARFRMLETIREFALEQLQESGEASDIYASHAACFLHLAEEANPQLKGHDQAQWLDRLEREHGNFRAALEWSLGRLPSLASAAPGESRGEIALRLAGFLSRFWDTRGHWREGIDWLEVVLAIPSTGTGSERAACLAGAGNLRQNTGEYGAARSLYEESLVIYRELGDRSGIAGPLNNLGNVACDQGDYTAARSLYEESLAIQRELGDRHGSASSLGNLAIVASCQGDFTAARSLFEESLAIYREMGDRKESATSLSNLGKVAWNQGDYTTARSLLEESLAIQRELGNRHGIANSLHNLGLLTGQLGDYAAARSLYEESLAIQRELGDQRGAAYSFMGLGQMASNQGDYTAARSLYVECLAVLREVGDRSGIAYSLASLGHVASRQGDYTAARSLYEESLAILRELGDRNGIAASLHNLGAVALDQGDYITARSLYEECLDIRRELGDRNGIAYSLEGLGAVAAANEDWRRACRLLGAAAALRETIGAPLSPSDQAEHDEVVSRVRAALGDEDFATTWNEGRALSQDQAIEYALEQP